MTSKNGKATGKIMHPPCAGTYARHFGSLDFAFQQLFTNTGAASL